MSRRRGSGSPGLVLVLLLLVGLHFYARPRVWDGRGAPDFLELAVLIFAIRSRPGAAALVGFLTGLMTDVLTPAKFGAGALANTIVAYLAAWGRAVFFADNLLVTAGLFAVGLWLRNLILLLASGTPSGELVADLTLWSPLQAVSTGVAGILVVLLFRDTLAIRLDE